MLHQKFFFPNVYLKLLSQCALKCSFRNSDSQQVLSFWVLFCNSQQVLSISITNLYSVSSYCYFALQSQIALRLPFSVPVSVSVFVQPKLEQEYHKRKWNKIEFVIIIRNCNYIFCLEILESLKKYISLHFIGNVIEFIFCVC